MDTSITFKIRQILAYDSIHRVLSEAQRVQLHRLIHYSINEQKIVLPEFVKEKQLEKVYSISLPELKYQREFEGGPVQTLYRFDDMNDFKQVKDLKELIPKII